jgi:hypothetical protein
MRTFRRLNDPERFYGLSWRGWIGLAAAGAVLYAAVRFSPLAAKPTISITVITLSLLASVLWGLSGQALGPGRFLIAAVRYSASRKQLELADEPDRYGLVLTDPAAARVDEAKSETGEVVS